MAALGVAAPDIGGGLHLLAHQCVHERGLAGSRLAEQHRTSMVGQPFGDRLDALARVRADRQHLDAGGEGRHLRLGGVEGRRVDQVELREHDERHGPAVPREHQRPLEAARLEGTVETVDHDHEVDVRGQHLLGAARGVDAADRGRARHDAGEHQGAVLIDGVLVEGDPVSRRGASRLGVARPSRRAVRRRQHLGRRLHRQATAVGPDGRGPAPNPPAPRPTTPGADRPSRTGPVARDRQAPPRSAGRWARRHLPTRAGQRTCACASTMRIGTVAVRVTGPSAPPAPVVARQFTSQVIVASTACVPGRRNVWVQSLVWSRAGRAGSYGVPGVHVRVTPSPRSNTTRTGVAVAVEVTAPSEADASIGAHGLSTQNHVGTPTSWSAPAGGLRRISGCGRSRRSAARAAARSAAATPPNGSPGSNTTGRLQTSWSSSSQHSRRVRQALLRRDRPGAVVEPGRDRAGRDPDRVVRAVPPRPRPGPVVRRQLTPRHEHHDHRRRPPNDPRPRRALIATFPGVCRTGAEEDRQYDSSYVEAAHPALPSHCFSVTLSLTFHPPSVRTSVMVNANVSSLLLRICPERVSTSSLSSTRHSSTVRARLRDRGDVGDAAELGVRRKADGLAQLCPIADSRDCPVLCRQRHVLVDPRVVGVRRVVRGKERVPVALDCREDGVFVRQRRGGGRGRGGRRRGGRRRVGGGGPVVGRGCARAAGGHGNEHEAQRDHDESPAMAPHSSPAIVRRRWPGPPGDPATVPRPSARLKGRDPDMRHNDDPA